MRRSAKLPARCAHCGSIPVMESGELTRVPGMNFARIKCPRCPAMMMSNEPRKTEELAVKKLTKLWNTRIHTSQTKKRQAGAL